MSGLLTWLRSTLRGEVSASEIYARRGAGTAAYSLAEEAGSVDGADRATCLFRVCAWNAFALETIAETLIDVDASDDPGRRGMSRRRCCALRAIASTASPTGSASPVSCRTIRRLASAAYRRSSRPGEAARRPGGASCAGLRAAYDALLARVGSDLARVAATSPGNLTAQARRVHAEMESAAEYAAAISLGNAGAVDRGEARWRLMSALENAFLLGQLLALPTLAEVASARSPSTAESDLEASASWLEIDSGWPVIDSEGRKVGLVQRVLGDRETGAFEGVVVAASIATRAVRVPQSSISAIRDGEITLSVRGAELAQ